MTLHARATKEAAKHARKSKAHEAAKSAERAKEVADRAVTVAHAEYINAIIVAGRTAKYHEKCISITQEK